ncbi:MarR family winged helix-turn-helix transcriptional regulator [Streptomyces indicus]|uniref:DNA-binding transcriptional regulator, MarR family n=1 Tax=Streptomyces indicus TaxID=417292 RepID=A0A1G9GQI8_9ACTN|nr:MarR family transcriptional regulator [Streptomyces indicus]SDL02960.1 DNA-binding transcriptional regulator, MarR family [Streptomyces indicus]
MTQHEVSQPGADDVEAVTRAVLTASRLLVAVSARSLAAFEDRVTVSQFRMLVVLSTQGPSKLVMLADRLGVNPSTAMRMVDRLITAGLADRQINSANRRETILRLTSEGALLVEEVTARRRHEIAAIVKRLSPYERSALVGALTVFTEAGGEPMVGTAGSDTFPLGWSDFAPQNVS